MKKYAEYKPNNNIEKNDSCDFIFYKADGSTDKNIGVKPIDNNLTSNIKFGEKVETFANTDTNQASCGPTCRPAKDFFKDESLTLSLGENATLDTLKTRCLDNTKDDYKNNANLFFEDTDEEKKSNFDKIKNNVNMPLWKACCKINYVPGKKMRYGNHIDGSKCESKTEQSCGIKTDGCNWEVGEGSSSEGSSSEGISSEGSSSEGISSEGISSEGISSEGGEGGSQINNCRPTCMSAKFEYPNENLSKTLGDIKNPSNELETAYIMLKKKERKEKVKERNEKIKLRNEKIEERKYKIDQLENETFNVRYIESDYSYVVRQCRERAWNPNGRIMFTEKRGINRKRSIKKIKEDLNDKNQDFTNFCCKHDLMPGKTRGDRCGISQFRGYRSHEKYPVTIVKKTLGDMLKEKKINSQEINYLTVNKKKLELQTKIDEINSDYDNWIRPEDAIRKYRKKIELIDQEVERRKREKERIDTETNRLRARKKERRDQTLIKNIIQL